MQIFAAIVLGVLSWSFSEYCIHRWMGHDRRFAGNFFEAEHTAHHSKGNYFSPIWKKVASAFTVLLIMVGPAIWVAGLTLGTSYVLGFVGFYLYYEWYHHREHVSAGIGPVARYLRKHHFHHHFHNPRSNHGVTSPLWDIVFRTYEAPSTIRVPSKLKMDWLCDPQTGDVWEYLKEDYSLRKPKSRSRSSEAS
jgi:sterol desaturase/sphingolipid hydroxylase (fatty acid hydroxylase superfamily)